MSKMKGIVFTGKEEVKILDLEIPTITPSEVLLETKSLAICTVEQRTFRSDNQQFSLGGHEVCGIIKEIGSDVRGFKVGDKVVSTFQYCGYCENCKKGHGEKCLNARNQKKRILDENIKVGNGGMAQFSAIPATQICKVGEKVPFEYACMTEPLGCCLHSVDKTKADFGETAVVIGAGIMGILHIKLLKMRGCRVIISEIDPERQNVALGAGADHVINPVEQDAVEAVMDLTNNIGADIVINTTSIYKVGEDAIKMLAPYGRLIAYASLHPAVPISVDFNEIHNKETEIIGTVSPRAIDFLKAAKLMEYNLINMNDVLHKVFKFEDAQKAFEESIKPNTYRCVILFS